MPEIETMISKIQDNYPSTKGLKPDHISVEDLATIKKYTAVFNTESSGKQQFVYHYSKPSK
jgi:hypothetical protein